MKRLVFLLTLFLVACGVDDEVNPVEFEELEEVQVSDEAEDKPDEAEEDEEEDTVQSPTGIVITGDRYVIQTGDTLSDIAQAAGVDLASIMRWNVITDANAIFVGEEIVLTGAPIIEYADAVVNNVVQDTTNYLLQLTQNDGEERYWNAKFLGELDIRNLYLHYLREGGEPRKIDVFAAYLFDHAPLLSNWQDIAKTVYSDLGIDAFEAVPGRPGYYYAINTSTTDLLIGVLNARTGQLVE